MLRTALSDDAEDVLDDTAGTKTFIATGDDLLGGSGDEGEHEQIAERAPERTLRQAPGAPNAAMPDSRSTAQTWAT